MSSDLVNRLNRAIVSLGDTRKELVKAREQAENQRKRAQVDRIKARTKANRKARAEMKSKFD